MEEPPPWASTTPTEGEESPCAVGSRWHGAAVLSAGRPVAVVVGLERVDGQPGLSMYSGFIAGGGVLYGPLAGYVPSGAFCLDGQSDVQNVGESPADIGSAYRDLSGSASPGGTVPRGILPGRAAVFYLPQEGVKQGFRGSVQVEAQWVVRPLVGVHHLARSCLAGTSVDYEAAYNLVQR